MSSDSIVQDPSLTVEALETLIADFVRELAGEDDSMEIDPDENLLAGGLVDSVGIVRLVAHVKDETAVTIPPQDLVPDNFRTVRVMAAYIRRQLDG